MTPADAEAARRLHQPGTYKWWQRWSPETVAWPTVCIEDLQPWPCRTTRAMDGEDIAIRGSKKKKRTSH